MPSQPPSALARRLAIACALLIGYASLHPFAGWTVTGLPTLDYLLEPWPRYFSPTDLVVNILGYLPLGFLLVAAQRQGRPPARAVMLACLLGGLLSLGVETAQNFLPSRVASNVDIGGNLAGTLIGALLGATFGRSGFAEGGLLQRWRASLVIPGRAGDAGLVLLALWLIAQLMPETPPFSGGDLRALLGIPTPVPFAPARYIRFEAILVASGLIAAGLYACCLLRGRKAWPIVLILTVGLGAKSLATGLFLVPGAIDAWLTPGARAGLAAGGALLLAGLLLPRLHQHALAGMALLVATVFANLMPTNPYLGLDARLLAQGNFANFHGLMQLVAMAWPFLALAWLSALGLWRGEHLSGTLDGDLSGDFSGDLGSREWRP